MWLKQVESVRQPPKCGCLFWLEKKLMCLKKEETELEKGLVELYTNMLILTFPKDEAEKIAKDMLEAAKEKMREISQDKLSPNFGNFILENEKEDPSFMNMDVKRQDGVRDEDVIWFWNMHPLERCMLLVFDDFFRIATFLKFKDTGMSEEEAANEMKKFFPIFGDPKNTSHAQGVDRPLPYELKDRINKWTEKNTKNLNMLEERRKKYTSMNAFIRAEIKTANI